ncbi:hypothetical protein ACH3XW_32605 [Acanthocheilonema viteae]
MAQLFVEETEVDEMFSESSDDETESQKHSESSQAVTQLGLRTAAFILQEMIINPSSCCSNQNVTPRLDDKSASGNASRETSADSLKDSGISETCELKSLNTVPSTTLVLEGEEKKFNANIESSKK